jgi:hypothetical protein
MKKILLSLMFLVITLPCFTQDFFRAKYFEIGYEEKETKEIFWQNKEKMQSTLISMGSRRIAIHTEKFQEYFLQGEKKPIEGFDGFVCEAINPEGKEFQLYFYKETDELHYMVIQGEGNLLKLHLFYLE